MPDKNSWNGTIPSRFKLIDCIRMLVNAQVCASASKVPQGTWKFSLAYNIFGFDILQQIVIFLVNVKKEQHAVTVRFFFQIS